MNLQTVNTYVFANAFDYQRICFADIINEPSMKYLDCKIDNKIYEYLSRLYASTKLAKYRVLPLRTVWYNLLINILSTKLTDHSLFLFYQTNRYARDTKFVQYLRKRFPNSKFVFFYTNISWDEKFKEIEALKLNYDLIFTFDPKEASRYGLEYHDNVYSKIEVQNSSEKNSDVLFIGYDKGRYDFLIQIYEHLTENGLKCDFTILGVNPMHQKYPGLINYEARLNYNQILSKIDRTCCILEVLKNGQQGSSLRLQEALIYQKKLLTTNHDVLNRAYFDPNQIQVIDSPSEINLSFINDSTMPDNSWAKYFSPKTFITEIKNRLFFGA